jgi:hypothetical protein
MIEALAIIGGIGTTSALVAVIVLAFKLASRGDKIISTLGELDKEREETRTVRSQLAQEEQAHVTTETQLEDEHALRISAEARLVLAQRRVTELLKSHLERASDEEIRAATAAAFGGFDDGVVPLSETEDGRLLRPGEDADVSSP